MNQLTNREKQVCELLAEGLSNEQIGAQLGISQSTTRHYVINIYRKLNVPNRFAIIQQAKAGELVRMELTKE